MYHKKTERCLKDAEIFNSRNLAKFIERHDLLQMISQIQTCLW